LIATLQKTSVRPSCQRELLQCGMLQWVVNLLEGRTTPYATEYACSLAINLSLNLRLGAVNVNDTFEKGTAMCSTKLLLLEHFAVGNTNFDESSVLPFGRCMQLQRAGSDLVSPRCRRCVEADLGRASRRCPSVLAAVEVVFFRADHRRPRSAGPPTITSAKTALIQVVSTLRAERKCPLEDYRLTCSEGSVAVLLSSGFASSSMHSSAYLTSPAPRLNRSPSTAANIVNRSIDQYPDMCRTSKEAYKESFAPIFSQLGMATSVKELSNKAEIVKVPQVPDHSDTDNVVDMSLIGDKMPKAKYENKEDVQPLYSVSIGRGGDEEVRRRGRWPLSTASAGDCRQLAPQPRRNHAGDSCEREIDATDPLRPSTNELSGAKLLLRRAIKENLFASRQGHNSEPRLGTATSQHTFVIETDRQKPLVLPVGLTDGEVSSNIRWNFRFISFLNYY
uniref:Adenomatosis polyposis coli 2 n=1 Tax=Angiostrongylus cantonensis TaxID=6313 RepID=A0A158PCF5_ANGCA